MTAPFIHRLAPLAGLMVAAILAAGPAGAGEPVPTRTLALESCAGDCDRRQGVGIADLILAVRVALGERPVWRCELVDDDSDGEVSAAELVRAIDNALAGCTGECRRPIRGRPYDAERDCLAAPEVLACRAPHTQCPHLETFAVEATGRCVYFSDLCLPVDFRPAVAGECPVRSQPCE